LYDGEVHDDGDEHLDIIGRLKPSRVSQGTTDKVPKELAVHEAIEPSPYTVDAGGDGDQTSIFMPYKVAHCEKECEKYNEGERGRGFFFENMRCSSTNRLAEDDGRELRR
jgi:hypothetical protein